MAMTNEQKLKRAVRNIVAAGRRRGEGRVLSAKLVRARYMVSLKDAAQMVNDEWNRQEARDQTRGREMTFRDTLTEEQKEAERAWEQRILTAERQRIKTEVVEPLAEALEKVEAWKLPPTNMLWCEAGGVHKDHEGACEPMSYGAAFGSNGERDFFRQVARAALSAARKAMEKS